jgi:hypothetical protein
MNANGPAAASAPSYARNFGAWVAELDRHARTMPKLSSEGRFGTDPFAFICGSIFFLATLAPKSANDERE